MAGVQLPEVVRKGSHKNSLKESHHSGVAVGIPTVEQTFSPGPKSISAVEGLEAASPRRPEASPAARSLRAALTQVTQATSALLSAGTPGADGPSDAVQQALERLCPIKRSLEEAVAVAEGAGFGEDHLVEILLRQRESALQHRAAADDRLREARRKLLDAKREMGEQRRRLERHERLQARMESEPLEARMQALQRRAAASQATLAELKVETEAMEQILAETKGKNGETEGTTRQLEREHQAALERNALAKAALAGEQNVIAYRRKKAAACAEADATFLRAREHYEASMAKLADGWAEKQSAYLSGVEALEAEVRELRRRLAEERALAGAWLGDQASARQAAVREVEKHVSRERTRLEEQRNERHTLLRREVVQTQHQLEDAQIQTQKHLDIHVKEARVTHQARLQREEAQSEELIQADFQAVLAAKREREEMERRAAKMKENYKSHAIKSKNYVKSLDKVRRDHLIGLWGV